MTGTKYLILFDAEQYDGSYNKTWYLKSQKSGAKNIFSHNYARIKFYS